MAEQFDGIVTIAANSGGTPVITLNGASGEISAGARGRDGDLTLRDSSSRVRLVANAENGTLILKDANGRDSVIFDARFGLLDLGAVGNEGDFRIRDNNGTFVFRFDSNFAVLDVGGSGNEGDIRLRNDAGDVSIHLDGGSGDIRLHGADVAEEFGALEEIEPGMVVVARGADEVRKADAAHDRRVIGIVAGAGGFNPALRLGARPGEDRVPISITGRAYCYVDALHGAVDIGDLLTTSITPGHAMKVGNLEQAAGAIVAKALGKLRQGTGIIPVLLGLR